MTCLSIQIYVSEHSDLWFNASFACIVGLARKHHAWHVWPKTTNQHIAIRYWANFFNHIDLHKPSLFGCHGAHPSSFPRIIANDNAENFILLWQIWPRYWSIYSHSLLGWFFQSYWSAQTLLFQVFGEHMSRDYGFYLGYLAIYDQLLLDAHLSHH